MAYRRGKFRRHLLPLSFYKEKGPFLYNQIQVLKELHQQKAISAAEFCLRYILFLSHSHRPRGSFHMPDQWSLQQGQKQNQNNPPGDFLKFVHDPNVSYLEGLQHHNPQSLKVRGVPLAAINSLLQWQSSNYELLLHFDIPTFETVFLQQSQGRRCVTALTSQQELLAQAEVLDKTQGRDPLGFLIHDLIHADHFFGDPDRKKSQTDFLKRVHTLYKERYFDFFLKDPCFQKDFEYLTSDMNSAAPHLYQTLRVIVRNAFKRYHGIPLKSHLDSDLEQKWVLYCDLFHNSCSDNLILSGEGEVFLSLPRRSDDALAGALTLGGATKVDSDRQTKTGKN